MRVSAMGFVTVDVPEMPHHRVTSLGFTIAYVPEAPKPVLRLPVLQRPKTRGDCKDGPRPCPWVSCKYHLFLDVVVKHASGALEREVVDINYPHLLAQLDDKGPDWDLEESCALDVADAFEGVGMSHRRAAAYLGRVKGVAKAAERKLRAAVKASEP